MSFLDGLRHKLRTLLNPGEYERQLAEEFRHHRELDAAQQADATAAARRFGNTTYHMEEVRRMTWLSRLDLLKQDAGYAWRSLRRTRGVTAMIVVTLALGIGVNAATFSVLDQLYLRDPAGVVEPDGVRRLWSKHTRTVGSNFFGRSFAYPQYEVLAEAAGGREKVAAMLEISDYRLGGTRAGPLTNVLYTGGNYFTLLGVRPQLGRFFTDAESRPGIVTRAVVISDMYWKTHLGGDRMIVGKTIKLDTLQFEVVGVAQPGFAGTDLRASHVWAPLGAIPGADTPRGSDPTLWASPRYLSFFAFTRMADQASVVAFEQRATRMLREANLRMYGATQADTLTTVHAASVIEARGPATARQEETITTRLQGIALIVLIIACANVVNLLLARAVSRKREIAVRLALGISRGRLIRLITIESLMLALLAAGAALLTAYWGGSLLRSQLMTGIDFAHSPLHPHVVWATLGVALGCGLIAGVIPAVQYSRPELAHDLKDGGRGSSRQRSRLRNGLVIAQAALSVVLLVGATLCVRTLNNIEGIDVGFDRHRVIYANMAYEPGQAPPLAERVARFAEVEERLRGRTGIEAVARTGIRPMGGMSFWSFWWGSDSSQSLGRNAPYAYGVSAQFFTAAGMRIVRGRSFEDGPAGEGQVVVNELLAKVLWPNAEAVGQCIRFDTRDAACHTVTGVVSVANTGDLFEVPKPQFYLPLRTKLTERMGGTILIVRVASGAEQAARREIGSMLKQAIPIGTPVFTTMNESIDRQYRPWRLGAQLFTGVSVLALIVALVGIYSTVAYSVGQRAHEFGVRVALGAKLNDVLNQVVGEGVRVVAIGIALGVGLSLLAGRLMVKMLFGVEPTDTSAMMLSGATMLLVAIVASVIPAWRAARADPVSALRGD
jgi:putative ABC transport system permease protein